MALTLLNQLKIQYGPVVGRRIYAQMWRPGMAQLAPLSAGAAAGHRRAWGQMTGGGGRRPSKWRGLSKRKRAEFKRENLSKLLAKHGVTTGDISTESFGRFSPHMKEAAGRAAEINEARRKKKADRGGGKHWAFDKEQHYVSGGFKIPRKESIPLPVSDRAGEKLDRKVQVRALGAFNPGGGPHQPTYSPEYLKYLAERRRRQIVRKIKRMYGRQYG